MSKISQDLLHKINDKYEGEFIDSDLCHSCGLDVFAKYQNFRGTGIVCTIGPACSNLETISEMIRSGMVIARFNFSHGAHEDHKKMMDLVKEASAKVSTVVPIALALDTKGPEIRTGLNKDNASITLVKDEKVTLTTDDAFKEQSTKDKVYLDYKSLSKSINVGQIILIADGTVVLKAIEITGNDVVCTVISGASFGSRKNCCLPLVKTDLPALSTKDISDIKFGMEQKVDIIFASFIRSADNVKEIRKLLQTTEAGKCIKIISKIENYEGVENIEEIINESDGIMVARGDLGMDLDLEKVVVAQKKIIALCNLKGKPVICATQMVESMINSYRPTRAEIADVTNAVIDGADCVMLSGESANGKYPVQAVKTMDMISHAAESMNRTKKRFEDIVSGYITMTDSQAIAMCAVSMSYKIKADGIFVLTTSGETAHLLSMFRPRCLIFAVSRFGEVVRTCHLYRNILPLLYTDGKKSSWQEDVDARLKFAVDYAIKNKFCQAGSKIVLVTGWKSGSGSSNCVRVSHITENNSIFGLHCDK